MSEYQYVHFLALDRSLDDQQIEFMRGQSSRAEVTRRDFTNEYHFGDFHGDAREMLRRGYDVHLHYANFGTRRLMIRLPAGLPCDRPTFDAFLVEDWLVWNADKKGKGGILEIEPEADAGTYDEYVDDPAALLPEIAPVRDLLIGGDLRPLYIAWLACACDEESLEPPVPAGLDKLTPALEAMADFYEVSGDLLVAAEQCSPPLPKATDAGGTLQDWIAKQSKDELRELVRRLLEGDPAATRAETLAQIRDQSGAAAWPMAEPARTLAQLRESAAALRDQRLALEKQAREEARRKRRATIAADPQKVIAEVEKLVKVRSVENYQRAAKQLAELRDALGPDRGPATARAVAEKLRRENPRLRRLVAALRKKELLD